MLELLVAQLSEKRKQKADDVQFRRRAALAEISCH